MAEPLKKILGEPIYEKILNEVACGRIDKYKALDIAYKLHEHVGGLFRISETEYNRRAFKVMLTNWYDKIAHEYTQDTAVKKILEVLRNSDISLLPLAKSIEQLHSQRPDNTQRAQVDVDTPDGKITPGITQHTTNYNIQGNFQGVLVAGGQSTVGPQQFGNKNQITNSLEEKLEKHVKPGQKEFLSNQGLTTLARMPGFASSLVQFSTILGSVCMIGGGTGFLAEIPALGIAFFSAGHVFFNKRRNKKPQYNLNLNPARYKLHFGNLIGSEDGDPTGKSFSFEEFNSKFQFKGSISYQGQLRSFPTVSNSFGKNSNKEEDYCALLLTAPNIEDLLKNEGLTYLKCGKDDYLNNAEAEIVSIFGHPEVDKERPLRVCWGIEKKSSASMNRLIYDNDTLPGNSGSPVIARGLKSNGEDQAYVVKGIHVQGNPNRAQILKNLSNWINSP